MTIDDELARALRSALPPRGETGPARDLWPELERRLSTRRVSVAPLDWLLAGAAALWLWLVPQGVTALLHLM